MTAAPTTSPSGPQSKTIDGLAVTSVSLEPADAFDLLPELAPILGAMFKVRESFKGPLEEAMAAIAAGNPDAEIKVSPDVIAQALRDAGEALGSGRLTAILVRLLRTTEIVLGSGARFRVTDRATFSLAFSEGRMWSAIPIAAFAFEVTYGNFSDVVSRLPGVGGRPRATP